MSSITFNCPNCGCVVTVGAEHAGKNGKCQTCGGGITVPFQHASLGPDLTPPMMGGTEADIEAAMGGMAQGNSKQAMIAAMAGKTDLGRGAVPVHGVTTGSVREGTKGSLAKKLPRLIFLVLVVGGIAAFIYFKPDMAKGLLQSVRNMVGI